MSAAKMVADSTQSDLPEKSSVKRKKTVDKKKIKKKKTGTKKGKKKSKEGDDEYDEYDLDLSNDIKPLGAFIKDRNLMLEEMFHCVQGASLQRALPDILKELTIDELKQKCLEQLVVMSKKRIRRLMAGDDPATISSSGTEDESTDDERPQETGRDIDLRGDTRDGTGENPVDREQVGDSGEEDGCHGYDGNHVVADSTSLHTGTGDTDRESLTSSRASEDRDLNRSPEDIYISGEDNEEDVEFEDEEEEGEIRVKKHHRTPPTNVQQEMLDGEEEDDGYLGEDHSFTAEDQDDDQNWEAEMEEDAMRIAGEIIHSTANRGGNSEEGKDDSSDVEEGEAEEEMERGDAVGDDMVVVITDENNDDYDDNNDDDDDDEDNNDDKGIKERRIDNKGKSEGEKSEMDEGEEVEEGEDLDKGKELEEGEEHENGEEEDGENDETSKPADMSISDQLVEDVKWAGTSQGGSAVITPAQAIAPVLTQNQMELLELEMRARAIKAMLMKQGPS